MTKKFLNTENYIKITININNNNKLNFKIRVAMKSMQVAVEHIYGKVCSLI
jgi:hypothetical protein